MPLVISHHCQDPPLCYPLYPPHPSHSAAMSIHRSSTGHYERYEDGNGCERTSRRSHQSHSYWEGHETAWRWPSVGYRIEKRWPDGYRIEKRWPIGYRIEKRCPSNQIIILWSFEQQLNKPVYTAHGLYRNCEKEEKLKKLWQFLNLFIRGFQWRGCGRCWRDYGWRGLWKMWIKRACSGNESILHEYTIPVIKRLFPSAF